MLSGDLAGALPAAGPDGRDGEAAAPLLPMPKSTALGSLLLEVSPAPDELSRLGEAPEALGCLGVAALPAGRMAAGAPRGAGRDITSSVVRGEADSNI